MTKEEIVAEIRAGRINKERYRNGACWTECCGDRRIYTEDVAGTVGDFFGADDKWAWVCNKCVAEHAPEPPKPLSFKLGMLVRLRSGGPVMVIRGIQSLTLFNGPLATMCGITSPVATATVTWMDGNRCLQETLPVECLVPSEEF